MAVSGKDVEKHIVEHEILGTNVRMGSGSAGNAGIQTVQEAMEYNLNRVVIEVSGEVIRTVDGDVIYSILPWPLPRDNEV